MLVAADADVALTGRDGERAEAAAAELGAIGLELDVRHEDSVRAGVDRAYSGSARSICWSATPASGCGPSTRASSSARSRSGR